MRVFSGNHRHAGGMHSIATGGVIPRGADAVVMIEQTELIEEGAAPASSCAARRAGTIFLMPDPTLRAAKLCCGEARHIGSREIGMLAACGHRPSRCGATPKVAVLSTGDELVEPGKPLGAGRGL